MTDLLLPIGRVMHVPQHLAAPRSVRNDVSAAVRSQRDIEDIGHAFGKNYRPRAPIMVLGPDNRTVILIVGDGVTEASELQDLAAEAYGKQEETIRKTGNGSDFASLREKRGLWRKEEFGTVFAEALQERIRKHKANPRTDPFRQPRMPDTGKTVFAVNGMKE